MGNVNKVYEFDPIIYPRKLWVYIGEDIEYLRKYFGGKEEVPDMDINTLGYTLCVNRKSKNKGGILIWFKNIKELNYRTITHESNHAALDIFDYIDYHVYNNNQECFCYLSGWISECLGKVKDEFNYI